VIMDVEATTTIRQAEVGAAKAMLDRTAEQLDITPSGTASGTSWRPSRVWLGRDDERQDSFLGSRRAPGSLTARSPRFRPGALREVGEPALILAVMLLRFADDARQLFDWVNVARRPRSHSVRPRSAIQAEQASDLIAPGHCNHNLPG
jgi:hypothetical protein